MEKKCFKCQKVMPLADFYRHAQMADGHLNKCKGCTKEDVNKHRYENIERIREYDRKRGLTDEHRAHNRENYRARISTEEGRAREWERAREYSLVRKFEKSVRTMTRRAILSGRLKKAPCERCGNQDSHAHHEDYYKPLDVTWLCVTCHGERHREINAEKRK